MPPSRAPQPKELPTTHEVEDLLDDLEGEVTNCRGAIAEDPGCIDPDRTMVAFEQLDASASRLRRRLKGEPDD